MKPVKALVLFTLALCIFATNVLASGVSLKEGQWELTTTMEIPGMPHKMPGITFTECLTQENLIPPVNEDAGCVVKDIQTNGNTTTYTMVCTQDGEITTGQGTFTYNHDKMSGEIVITRPDMKIITSYTGKWIGKCE